MTRRKSQLEQRLQPLLDAVDQVSKSIEGKVDQLPSENPLIDPDHFIVYVPPQGQAAAIFTRQPRLTAYTTERVNQLLALHPDEDVLILFQRDGQQVRLKAYERDPHSRAHRGRAGQPAD